MTLQDIVESDVTDEVVDEMLEDFERSLARRRKAAVVEARRARDSAREMQADARNEDTQGAGGG
jgi:hypothetical protein